MALSNDADTRGEPTVSVEPFKGKLGTHLMAPMALAHDHLDKDGSPMT
jgi:hypothetical protein